VRLCSHFGSCSEVRLLLEPSRAPPFHLIQTLDVAAVASASLLFHDQVLRPLLRHPARPGRPQLLRSPAGCCWVRLLREVRGRSVAPEVQGVRFSGSHVSRRGHIGVPRQQVPFSSSAILRVLSRAIDAFSITWGCIFLADVALCA
jgi:hypothetical protein